MFSINSAIILMFFTVVKISNAIAVSALIAMLAIKQTTSIFQFRCCNDIAFTIYHSCINSATEERVSSNELQKQHHFYYLPNDAYIYTNKCKTRMCESGQKWKERGNCGWDCWVAGCGCSCIENFTPRYTYATYEMQFVDKHLHDALKCEVTKSQSDGFHCSKMEYDFLKTYNPLCKGTYCIKSS